MPFGANPMSRIYPMPVDHWQQRRNHWQHGYNTPFTGSAGPTYPIMMGQHTNHQYQNRSQAPSSGPRRNQHKRHRKAEPHTQYHKHESSGSVVKDRSTGVDPSMARINTSKETRAGKVWRTPSENPLMANCNLTQSINTLIKDHHEIRDRWWKRTDPSIYQMPTDFMGFKGMLIPLSMILYQKFYQQLFRR